MLDRRKVEEAIDEGQETLRLNPGWVHRSRRLKPHPDGLYAFGGHRGGINEGWFSPTTKASNGPATLSRVRHGSSDRFLLKAASETAGDLLLGPDVISRDGGGNLLCKFFDNMEPIPHHLHQSDALGDLVGQRGKPEAYYFPKHEVAAPAMIRFGEMTQDETADAAKAGVRVQNTGAADPLVILKRFGPGNPDAK
jgi:hypothetical protein